MVFIRGGFNSRIGTQNKFITKHEKDLNYLPTYCESDTIRSVRNNQDTSVNEYEQQLLDLSIETKLRILNQLILSMVLDISRLSWLQYSRFSFNIRSMSDKFNYSTATLNFLSDHRPIFLKLIRNYSFLPNKITKDTQVC